MSVAADQRWLVQTDRGAERTILRAALESNTSFLGSSLSSSSSITTHGQHGRNDAP